MSKTIEDLRDQLTVLNLPLKNKMGTILAMVNDAQEEMERDKARADRLKIIIREILLELASELESRAQEIKQCIEEW